MRIFSFCILSAALFQMSVAHADGFEVVGLQNTAVRLKNPLDESALLWMGDRLGSAGSQPEFVRVDDEAGMVLQWGPPFPRGALFEFSEFSLISVSDSQIHLWSGRARMINGTWPDSQAEGHAVSLKTSFGNFSISRNSMAEAEIGGQRMMFFCLAGEASFEKEESDSGPNPPVSVSAGQMIRVSSRGRYDIRRTPPEIQGSLESKPLLQMRYTASGSRPPRIRWFSPRPGEIVDRQRLPVMGRVDLSDGPVEVSVARTPVQVQSSGVFTATVDPRAMLDSVAVFFKKENSAGTMVLRISYDFSSPELQIDPVAETTRLKQILIGGRVNEPASLFFASKSIPIRGGGFAHLIDLAPGKNKIQLTAFDRAGNRSDASLLIFREPMSSGYSAASPPPVSDTQADTAPAPPIILKSGLGESGFVLEFSGPPPGNSEYRVYRSYSRAGPFVAVGESSENSFTDPGPFDPGTSVFFRASIMDGMGRESRMTDLVHFSLSASKPQPPSPVTFKIEGTKLRLFWPRNPSGEIGGYNVYRIDSGTARRVASLAGPPYLADIPETFAEMFFRVGAVSASSLEESDWSDTARVTK